MRCRSTSPKSIARWTQPKSRWWKRPVAFLRDLCSDWIKRAADFGEIGLLLLVTQVAMGQEPEVVPAMWQPTPLVEPRVNAVEGNRGRGWDPSRILAPAATRSAFGPSDRVDGREALPKSTTDLGDLLKKSLTVPSVQVQAKTPIVHDPRVRGSRVGSLAAAGSHWIPARADLDTIVSKFDSRQVASAEVISGPYTSLLGPGFAFIDVEFYGSPRYAQGVEAHGSTDLEYRANGAQHFGQQSFLLGSQDWGARFSYANRGGNDYYDGSQSLIRRVTSRKR